MGFKEKLEQLTRDMNISALARRASLPGPTIREYLEHGRAPSINNALLLAYALGVDVGWLIDPRQKDWPPVYAKDQSALPGEAHEES